MKKELIELRVNGRKHEVAIEPRELLLDLLRQELDFTGSKRGCDDSSCGACTVLVDGVPTLTHHGRHELAPDEQDAPEITTVEGVADHGAMAAIQKAYGDWGGAQCGYCTPGFMMTVKALWNAILSQAKKRSARAQREPVSMHRIYADVPGDKGSDSGGAAAR